MPAGERDGALKAMSELRLRLTSDGPVCNNRAMAEGRDVSFVLLVRGTTTGNRQATTGRLAPMGCDSRGS